MSHEPVALHHKTEGDGPDVLLAHGLFGNGENLGGLARRLREQFRVHTVDMRNHGRSPHSAVHTYAALAADLEAYLDAAACQQAHVIGHSMGGKAAMQLALTAPERVASLGVIDIAPKPYPRHHDAILSALQALLDDPPTSRQAADSVLAGSVSEAAVRQFLLKNLQREDAGHYGLKLNLEAIINHYDDIAGWDESLAATDTPTFFVVGGESDYVTDDDRARIAQQFPQASARLVPGGSHWVHAEKPDLVASVLIRSIQANN